jgi:hypothetical protein
MQQLQLPLPSDKGAQGPETPSCDASVPPQESLHGIYGHGSGLPVHGEGPVGCGSHLLVHQMIGRGTQQDRSRSGPLLETRRYVEGRANCRGQPLRVLSETAHHHQT